MKGDEIILPFKRHSNETVSLMKHVIEYENMKKWMVELIRKFENRGSKIALVNSILITKSTNLLLFILILYVVGSPL